MEEARGRLTIRTTQRCMVSVVVVSESAQVVDVEVAALVRELTVGAPPETEERVVAAKVHQM